MTIAFLLVAMVLFVWFFVRSIPDMGSIGQMNPLAPENKAALGASSLESLLPPHACSLSVTHNPHLDYHQTVDEWTEEFDRGEGWVSPEEKDRAIKTNELWELMWYPKTPIGSCSLYASSLAALLVAVHELSEKA